MMFINIWCLRVFSLPKAAACNLPLVATVLLCLGFAGRLHGSIASENALAGNLPSEWEVSGIGDPTIQGFATDFSVNRGSTVSFKINTNANAYRIDIYRIGYYGGRGARKVATINPSASLPQNQPAFVRDAATGLVDCGNWAVSASWAVPANAVSGVYIARPVRTDTNGASHIFFIVRNDAGASDLLFQTADTTWQAYNNYGGANLYRGNGPGYDGRAFKVSYNRPFNNRGATTAFAEKESFFFNAEYPMIRWLEANGYDVSYASGMDTDRRGSAALATHKVFLSVGHDEYWSGAQRANVEAARAAGVNLAFFAGNDVYWKTRWENSIAGTSTPYRTLVCYKETNYNTKKDPSAEWTGTWRDPRFSPPADGGRPENELTGQLFMVDAFRYDPISISSAEGKARFWRNTSIATLANGASATLPTGVLGFEWNEVVDNGFNPPGLFRLSTTEISVPKRLLDYGSYFGPGVGTHSLTLYRDNNSEALVFGAGTIQWSWGLDATHDFPGPPADVRMQQATVNLFADMGGVQPATLQSGLVAATQSTDTIAPTSVIQMPPGGTVQVETPVTITGTAADTGGGIPAGVEISYDGGATWRMASGAANWSATWTPSVKGPITLKSRAVDDSGRIEVPGPGISVTVSGGLINGSFESDFTGWTVTGNVFIESETSSYTTTNGIKIASFNGNSTSDSAPNGVISQIFDTSPGTSYTLAFDMGVIGGDNAEQRLQVTVDGAGNLLSQIATKTKVTGSTAQWAAMSYTFVANSATTTLTFRDISTVTNNIDALLDNVRVTGSINTPPVIGDVADLSTDEDTATPALAFTIGDLETAAADLTVTSDSSNPSLVPLANIVHGGSDAARTVTITAAANQSGSATIILTVSDGFLTTSDTFVLTVNPINDAPLAISQAVSVSEDGAVEITLTGSDPDGDSLTFLTGNAAHGTVSLAGSVATYRPAANYHGIDGFNFTANDGIVDSAPAAVSITVNEVFADDFIDWLAEHDLVGGEADSDNDSIHDAVEYVIGGDPVTGMDVHLLPTCIPVDSLPGGSPEDPACFRFTYRRTDRSINNPSATISVEWATALAGPWTNVDATADIVIDITDDGFGDEVDRVDVYMPFSLAADGKFFTRLKVALTPP